MEVAIFIWWGELIQITNHFFFLCSFGQRYITDLRVCDHLPLVFSIDGGGCDWSRRGLRVVGCEPAWLTALPGWRLAAMALSLWKQTRRAPSANLDWARAPGILETHAEDFLGSKTHINTHTYIYIHTHTHAVLRLCFVGHECICAWGLFVRMCPGLAWAVSLVAVWSSFDTVSGSLT